MYTLEMRFSGLHRSQRAVRRFPKLSNVTLAFLEASCQRQGIEAWRVYDVVATMRQQKERQQQARLPQPAKRSHHFAEDEDPEPQLPLAASEERRRGSHERACWLFL